MYQRRVFRNYHQNDIDRHRTLVLNNINSKQHRRTTCLIAVMKLNEIVGKHE